MGLFGGLFESNRRTQSTTNTYTTTTTNETGDVGLTGEHAVRLAESAQVGAVMLGQQFTDLQNNVMSLNTARDINAYNNLTDMFNNLLSRSNADNITVTENMHLLATESGKSFSQLLGGASDLFDKGGMFIESSADYGGQVLDFTKNQTGNAYEFSGSVIDSMSNKAIGFADKNISAITQGAIDSSKFVTDTARDIAGSIIPQTKELQQIAMGMLAVVGVITVVSLWRK